MYACMHAFTVDKHGAAMGSKLSASKLSKQGDWRRETKSRIKKVGAEIRGVHMSVDASADRRARNAYIAQLKCPTAWWNAVGHEARCAAASKETSFGMARGGAARRGVAHAEHRGGVPVDKQTVGNQ